MKTVLYADDNLEIIELVKVLIERAGYQLLTARDGNEAVQVSLEENPDLVLMDINMPGMDGLSAVRQLRDDGFNNPVIMLTASESEEDRESAIDAGSDEYVLKTIDMGDVEIVLSRYLSDVSDFL
ncbi:MAG: response regulator [Gammaproteobacteria bacterium]|nr:response regulator [Gammaproteobacteria bacterium]